jgi:DNA polymerase II large subunit
MLTEGVLVAPTEGIAKIRIKNNPDGSDCIAVYYSGPIRSAGGTAVALSVMLADIARRVVGIGDYRPTDTQIERYVEEIDMYEARIAHLQYKPPEKDIVEVIKNCPVCIDGDPTEDVEVSTFRNVPGVETNRIRGGIPLVICEGIAQKAAKLLKYSKKLTLGWGWLENIIKISKKEDRVEINEDDTYLDGLVAGRPVFSYPSRPGGFRLRYGKSKTNGLMAKNIHGATMILLDGFLAIGTHTKLERPGKGCVVSPYEDMEPPVVKLHDGTVVKVTTIEQARHLHPHVLEILFLGDLLINYGDFFKSNHPLMPGGWCSEWFLKECEAKNVSLPLHLDAKEAFEFSRIHHIPLHPDYTFHWHDLTALQLRSLVDWLTTATLHFDRENLVEVKLKNDDRKRILEILLVEHRVIVSGMFILTESDR